MRVLLILAATFLLPLAAASGNSFDVRDYGATGDGVTLDTAALNRAVQACAEAGGGTVCLPPGRYLSGTIRLLSHVTLRIEGGAVLLGSERPEDYPDTASPWGEHGNGRPEIAPLIYAEDAKNISLSGRGTIDGQGAVWWRRLRLSGPAKYPPGPRTDEDRIEAAKISRGRPKLVRFVRCQDVVIEQVHLENSPAWTVHPLFCERVTIDGISITSPPENAHNTDGINPESCRDVQILNCRIDTGDDGITLKSGKNEAGRGMAKPCENIVIANCIVHHAHGGVTIGSEMSGGVRNVTVTNCVFQGTDNGIRLKTERGRGGVVEGVSVSNIVMQDVPHPFHITMFYSKGPDRFEAHPVDATTPAFQNMLFSNITARGAERAGHIFGLPESPVHDLTFSNVHIESKQGFEIVHGRGITFLDTVVDTQDGPALILRQTRAVETSRLSTRRPHDGVSLIHRE